MQSQSPTVHVILTNGRSGSNFLCESLNQHPQVCNFGEVLGSYMPSMKLHERFGYGGSTVEEYLDYILSSRSHFEIAQLYSAFRRFRRRSNHGKNPWRNLTTKSWNNLTSIGFKDFVIRFEQKDIADYLLENKQIKVIGLVRENTLRRAISLFSLTKTGIISVSDKTKSGRIRLTINPDELIPNLRQLELEKHAQLEMLNSIDPERCIRVSYERLFHSTEDRRRTLARVFRFLDVEPIEAVSRSHRILDPDLSRTIANYNEVAAAIRNSPYAAYLAS